MQTAIAPARLSKSLIPVSTVHVRVDGRECINFCSNDYLGLSGHVDVRRAMAAAIERHGVGSGAAHLVTGHTVEQSCA